MKKVFALVMLIVFTFAACGEPPAPGSSEAGAGISDSAGNTVELPEDPKVVCLYGSYAQAWLLAGGKLVGVTDDAVSDRELDVGEAEIVGTVKEPNAEAIIALDPDLVIFSEDIVPQTEMVDVLTGAGIPCSGYRVDTFEDYAGMMKDFCEMNAREDLIGEYVDKPRKQIESAREAYGFKEDGPRVLLIRA